MGYREDAKVFKALADESRLALLASLKTGEKCACCLSENLNISQPTLSHHMKLLCDSGLVDYEKKGKWMHYNLAKRGKELFDNMMQNYFASEDHE